MRKRVYLYTVAGRITIRRKCETAYKEEVVDPFDGGPGPRDVYSFEYDRSLRADMLRLGGRDWYGEHMHRLVRHAPVLRVAFEEWTHTITATFPLTQEARGELAAFCESDDSCDLPGWAYLKEANLPHLATRRRLVRIRR